MKALVEEAMRDGALGLSTGLVYVPANFAATEEVIELARVAARHGGIYVSHMRDEATGLLDSVRELIRISREAGLPAQINHHKAVGAGQWGWSERTLAMIDSARAEGLDIKHDLYPYTASSTGSGVLFPQWALAGGRDAFRERAADPATRARIRAEVRRILMEERGGGDLSRVQFRVLASDPRYNGRTLADLAADRGLPNDLDAGADLIIDLQLQGGFSAIYHAMDEADVIRIMRHPWAMFETDGDPVRLRRRLPAPAQLRRLPAGAGPLRPRAAGAHAGGGGPQDDLAADGADRAARARGGARGDARRPGRLRRRSDRGPRDLHRPAPVRRRRAAPGRQRRPGDPGSSFTGERPGRVLRGPARPDRVAGEDRPRG
jgi:N-acyl-D-amino-acid deacylase